MSTRSFPVRTLLLAVVLLAAQVGGGEARAQAGADAGASGPQAAASRTLDQPTGRQAPAPSTDTASASVDEGSGVGLVGDAERAISAFAVALREVARPDTWSGASSPRTSGLQLLSTPLGRLGAVLAFFGAAVWSLFNPGRALVFAAWIAGFAWIVVGERTGRMWLGVGSTLLYWVGLHYLLQRAEARRSRARTAWGDS